MLAGTNDNMGKYVQKQLTIQIAQRTSEQSIWGDLPVYATQGLRISGQHNIVSGDISINGTVNVTGSANRIDGTLACCNLVNTSPFSYIPPLLPCPNSSATPDLDAVQSYFKTNLSAPANLNGSTNYTDEFVFQAGVTSLTSTGNPNIYDSSTHTLAPGLYYSPGTITLSDAGTSGNVTLIANEIVITNSGGASYAGVISLKPYYKDLLFWANGSQGTLNGSDDGDIQINGASANNPCVALEGVLYAPNGEIELAGSGVKYYVGIGTIGTDVIYRASLDKGALVAKYLTIAGDYWAIYRW